MRLVCVCVSVPSYEQHLHTIVYFDLYIINKQRSINQFVVHYCTANYRCHSSQRHSAVYPTRLWLYVVVTFSPGCLVTLTTEPHGPNRSPRTRPCKGSSCSQGHLVSNQHNRENMQTPIQLSEMELSFRAHGQTKSRAEGSRPHNTRPHHWLTLLQ